MNFMIHRSIVEDLINFKKEILIFKKEVFMFDNIRIGSI